MNQFQEYGYNVRSFDQFIGAISREYDVPTSEIYDILSGDETVGEILNLMEDYEPYNPYDYDKEEGW